MSNHGSFFGNPKTEWLHNGNDRDMSIIEEFWYLDPNGRKWIAPAFQKEKSIINGASIPRALWSLIGSPYIGAYRRASIVHDVACNDPTVNRKDADVMFYHACLAGGCSNLQATILYAGVRIGAWLKKKFPQKMSEAETTRFPFLFEQSSEEQFIQRKFQKIADQIYTCSKGGECLISLNDADSIINENIEV